MHGTALADGFNEAAAFRRGRASSRRQQADPAQASMRPRLFAAEEPLLVGFPWHAADASMRPRLFAAEEPKVGDEYHIRAVGFNEAAAFRRGRDEFLRKVVRKGHGFNEAAAFRRGRDSEYVWIGDEQYPLQ